MATWFHPPPPNVSRSPQPYAGYSSATPETGGIAVNDPPYSAAAREQAAQALVYGWSPDPWVYTYMGKGQPFAPATLPVVITNIPINPPPFGAPGRLARTDAVIQWQQPDPWAWIYAKGAQGPYQPPHLPPKFGVDVPPFPGYDAVNLVAIGYIIAQPDPWTYTSMGGAQPYQRRTLPPSITAVPADNPSFTYASRIDWLTSIVDANQPPPPNAFIGGRQAMEPRHLPPSITAVPSDKPNPPRHFNFETIWASWQQPWPNPTLAQHSIQPILPLPRSYVIVIV